MLGVWCIEEQFRTCPRFKAGFKISKFFTPNSDGFQDEWFVTDPDNSITRIVIFDRFGKNLFTGNGSSRWDGIYNNIPMPTNGYWYIIEKGSDSPIMGSFSLFR